MSVYESKIPSYPDTNIAYTDGACKGNPGIGGWGCYLVKVTGEHEAWCGGAQKTTNNQMELMGAIYALKNSSANIPLQIWTDSSYVKNGITSWITNWKAKGWKTANKKPVANQTLWQQLDDLRSGRKVSWHWVKGHAGHIGNEKADELANIGVERSRKQDYNALLIPKPEAANDTVFTNLATDLDSKKKLNAPYAYGNDLDLQTNTMDALEVNSPATSYDIDNLAHKGALTVKNNVISNALSSDPHANAPVFDGDTSKANPNFVALLPKPLHKNEENRQLIMDTETTGLDALKGYRIIEVGIVELVNRKFTGQKLHVYINPERSMEEDAIRIHGISEAFLQDKPKFKEVAQNLYDFMQGAEIIAHNAPFDMGFLSMEFEKVGLTGFADTVSVTDSLFIAKTKYPGQKNTLDALVRRLNVGKQDRTFHGALLDAEILAEVYLAMTGGQVTLDIDDKQKTAGHNTHAKFSELAHLLVADSHNDSAHTKWLNDLKADYPKLNEVWH